MWSFEADSQGIFGETGSGDGGFSDEESGMERNLKDGVLKSVDSMLCRTSISGWGTLMEVETCSDDYWPFPSKEFALLYFLVNSPRPLVCITGCLIKSMFVIVQATNSL